MEYLIIALSSYLMGSIPFGFLLTKIFLKKDIRDIGSGNIGATNALRTGNKSLGYTTLALDITKAILPVLYVKFNFPDYIFISSLSAFLGHVFPVWLKFKGGKGVATLFGGFLFINPYTAILSIMTWVLMVKITKLSSLGALVSIFILTIANFIFIDGGLNKSLILILMIIIYYKHKDNIKRLVNKSENKIDL